jgi:hypothetical protein
MVKIELLGDDTRPVNVEMAHERFRKLDLAEGMRVVVTPRDARVFVEEDYAI